MLGLVKSIGLTHWLEQGLTRTRNPGHTIVEEGERLGSDLVFLATADGPASERALGSIATYLLAHRPCRVVIASSPPARNGRQDGAGVGVVPVSSA